MPVWGGKLQEVLSGNPCSPTLRLKMMANQLRGHVREAI